VCVQNSYVSHHVPAGAEEGRGRRAGGNADGERRLARADGAARAHVSERRSRRRRGYVVARAALLGARLTC
jgi:hypothetical protein